MLRGGKRRADWLGTLGLMEQHSTELPAFSFYLPFITKYALENSAINKQTAHTHTYTRMREHTKTHP